MKRIISVFFLSFFFVCLFFSSCQGMGTRSAPQEPRVTLKSVEIDRIGLNGVDLIGRVEIVNPNSFDIPFPDVEWQLFVNANYFIGGNISRETRLRSRSTVTVDLPFNVTYSGLYNTFASLWGSKEADYNVAVNLRFPLPVLSEKTFSMNYSGTLPLFQMPVIRYGTLRNGRTDFSGVEQELEFTVENPNVFPIPFPEISWDYTVNGITLLYSSFRSGGEINAHSQGSGIISLKVLYSDITALLGTLNTASVQSLLKLDSLIPAPIEIPVNAQEITGVIPVLRMPELSFREINIINLGMLRFEFLVTWEIENRNDFSFEIEQFDYSVIVNNNQWAQGIVPNPPRIEPNSKTVIQVDVTITTLTLITDIMNIMNRGTGVNYRTEGNISIKSDLLDLNQFELPFDLAGITRLIRL